MTQIVSSDPLSCHCSEVTLYVCLAVITDLSFEYMQIRTNKEYNNSSFICNHHVSILWWRNLVKSQFALKIPVLIAGVPYYLTLRDDVVTSSATVAAAM